MRLTPLHLEIFIHYHICSEVFPRSTPTILQYKNDLVNAGLLNFDSPNSYATGYHTAKGNAFMEALLTTPMPVEKWSIPAQKERTL